MNTEHKICNINQYSMIYMYKLSLQHRNTSSILWYNPTMYVTQYNRWHSLVFERKKKNSKNKNISKLLQQINETRTRIVAHNTHGGSQTFGRFEFILYSVSVRRVRTNLKDLLTNQSVTVFKEGEFESDLKMIFPSKPFDKNKIAFPIIFHFTREICILVT